MKKLTVLIAMLFSCVSVEAQQPTQNIYNAYVNRPNIYINGTPETHVHRLQISDLGFRISEISFQVSGSGYCIPPSQSRVSGLRYVRRLGSVLWVSCVQFHLFRISCFRYCIPAFRFHVSGYGLLSSYS